MKNLKRFSLVAAIFFLMLSSSQAQSVFARLWTTTTAVVHSLEGWLGLLLIGTMAFAYKKLHVKHLPL